MMGLTRGPGIAYTEVDPRPNNHEWHGFSPEAGGRVLINVAATTAASRSAFGAERT